MIAIEKMNMKAHQPVLLDEAIEALAIRPDGIYIDATFGRGGHSRAILERLADSGKLLVIDKDHEAIEHAHYHFKADNRLTAYHSTFANIAEVCQKAGVFGKVNGILLDLGVSSPQLDTATRGFSFLQDGPLDMRMDVTQSLSATTWINEASLEEMVYIFKTYGEERYARRIAQAIIEARVIAPILTTETLASIVKIAHPRWEKHKHPATRVFQAIRIHINAELSDLSRFLEDALACLAPTGRIVVISFHSLEDRIVKQFMKKQSHGEYIPKGIPVYFNQQNINFKRLGKAIKASALEVSANIRARSAIMRVGEKIA